MPVPGHFRAIVVRTVMVVTRRDDLSTFHEDCAKVEAHGRLSSSVSTLRQVKLRLVHRYRLGTEVKW